MSLRPLGGDRHSGRRWSGAGWADLRPNGRFGRIHPGQAAALLPWCAVVCLCLVTARPGRAASFSEWSHRQEIQLSAAGLIKLDLPPETLDAARPGLEDVRVIDPSGLELPYVIERADPPATVVRAVKSVRVSLGASSTVLTLDTGVTDPLDGVTLTTPADTFIKAVQVDGSTDGKSWRTLAQGLPIFRRPNGASQLHLPLPPGAWPFLRLTVDDQRSSPVPFTGVRIHAATRELAPREPAEVRITERTESPGETRLTLNLTAAHLHLAALQIESPDPLFTRRVTLAAKDVEENAIREKALAEGAIFRIALPGRPVSSQLVFPVERVTPSRELLFLIRNGDSPPLQISAIRAQRRSAYLIFMARQGGTHAILTGNRHAQAPRYDLASLGVDFKATSVAPLRLSPLAPNPDFRPAEALPDITTTGPALDVSAWTYRKLAHTTGNGVQQLDLDLEVLSRALPTFADLRLMSNGRQLPYILEHTSSVRALVPQVTAAADPRRSKLSRWALKLPHRNLPLTRLACTTGTPLFRREVVLYEEATDERGGRHQRELGRATWVQTPARQSKELLLTIAGTPTTDTLFLETNNDDNPPIMLENLRLLYPISRIHFKAAPDAYLYYGNRRAEAPRYDLSLISTQVLSADRVVASLGAEEGLTKSGWPERVPLMGSSSVLLWAVLAMVVVVLLVIISRLLPKTSPPPGG